MPGHNGRMGRLVLMGMARPFPGLGTPSPRLPKTSQRHTGIIAHTFQAGRLRQHCGRQARLSGMVQAGSRFRYIQAPCRSVWSGPGNTYTYTQVAYMLGGGIWARGLGAAGTRKGTHVPKVCRCSCPPVSSPSPPKFKQAKADPTTQLAEEPKPAGKFCPGQACWDNKAGHRRQVGVGGCYGLPRLQPPPPHPGWQVPPTWDFGHKTACIGGHGAGRHL